MAGGAHQRQAGIRIAGGAPLRAVAVGDQAHMVQRPIAHHIAAIGHAPGHAVRIADAVPEWRMRHLQRRHGQRHLVKVVEAPFEAQFARPGRRRVQCPHHHFIRFEIARLRLLGIHTVIAKLVRRYTAPDTQLETATAQVIEHADLLGQAQRVIQRQRVHQRPEQNAFGALRHRRMEYRRRRRHAQRRGVVFGGEVDVHADALIRLHQLETVLVEVSERQSAVVEMVEYAELHGRGHEGIKSSMAVVQSCPV